MSLNEEHEQVEVARRLSADARTLAHSTREIPAPSDSYTLLGELVTTVESLEQTLRQLASWHARVVDGTHYEGEDGRGDGATATVTAAAELELGAAALNRASVALRVTHSANGMVRWFDDAQ